MRMTLATQANGVFHLTRLSDARLVAELERLLRSTRVLSAELVAHLAEVEERRLHLKAGVSSLFMYCVGRHGMSEDEACRRIEVTRLGRRFPAILDMLTSGQLSMTVASLLKRARRIQPLPLFETSQLGLTTLEIEPSAAPRGDRACRPSASRPRAATSSAWPPGSRSAAPALAARPLDDERPARRRRARETR